MIYFHIFVNLAMDFHRTNLYELPFGYFAYMISLSICPYNESLYCFLASYIHFIHDLGLFFQNWFPLPLGLSRTYVIYSFS